MNHRFSLAYRLTSLEAFLQLADLTIWKTIHCIRSESTDQPRRDVHVLVRSRMLWITFLWYSFLELLRVRARWKGKFERGQIDFGSEMISRSHFCTVGDRCVVVFFLSVSFFLSFSISFSHTRASQSIKIEVKGKRQPSSRRISHVSIVPRFTVVPFRSLSPSSSLLFFHLFTLSLSWTLLRRAYIVRFFVRSPFLLFLRKSSRMLRSVEYGTTFTGSYAYWIELGRDFYGIIVRPKYFSCSSRKGNEKNRWKRSFYFPTDL